MYYNLMSQPMNDINYQSVEMDEEDENKRKDYPVRIKTNDYENQLGFGQQKRDFIYGLEQKKIKFVFIFIILILVVGQLAFLNKKQQVKKEKIQHSFFNEQYLGEQFGKYNSTARNISQMGFNQQEINSNIFHLQDRTQMLSKSFLTQSKNSQINFGELQKQLSSQIAHEVYSFVFNHSIDNKWSKKMANLTKQFDELKTEGEFEKMLNQFENDEEAVKFNLTMSSLKSNSKLVEGLEYYYADKKYGVGKQEQNPICIFTEGPGVTKQDIQQYVDSIEKQNYSNFHVVYVNEYATYFSGQNILLYLNQSDMRVKNRIEIVTNLQYLGTLANTYFWIKQFCDDDDIVLVLGKKQSLISRQTLKIINSFYMPPHIWYASSLSIENSSISQQAVIKNTHVRTFRRKVLDSIPVSSLVDYKLSRKLDQIWPKFYIANLNNFLEYIQIKEVAKYRKGELNQFLMLNSPQIQQQLCLSQRKDHHQQQIKRMGPLQPVFELGKNPKLENFEFLRSQTFKNSENAYQKLYDCEMQFERKRFHKKTVINEENSGKAFEDFPNLLINLGDYIPKTRDEWKSIRIGETKSAEDAIYVLTPTDLNKLVDKIDFWKYRDDLLNEIAYQLLEFEFDEEASKPQPLLQFTHFKSNEQIEEYLTNLPSLKEKSEVVNISNFNLAVRSLFDPSNQAVKEAELYYFNKKYNISSQSEEVPICIFTSERNIIRKNQYMQYFDAMENLNYSNYQIIYIDDLSTDDSAYLIYDLVRNGNYKRMRNRMKVIHNFQALGSAGNLFIWPQKLCDENSIVVNIDADDAILGAQTLKVLNSIYQDQNIWYAHSKYLLIDPQKNNFTSRGSVSQKLKIKTSQYRRSRNFRTAHIRTWRNKLMKAVPIYQIMDIHYNSTTKRAWPSFQALAQDTTQVHAHFELAGNKRIFYIEDYLYSYYSSGSSTRNCYFLHERFDEIKSTTKAPLQQLSSLNERGRQMKNNTIPQQLYELPGQLNRKAINQNCFKP